MGRRIVKEKSTSKFLVLDADKYIGTPNLSRSPEETELEKMKTRRMKRRLQKISEMEADMYLSEVEEELKKRRGKTSKIKAATAESDAMATALATNPAYQEKWLQYSDQQRAVILAGIQGMKAQGSSQGGMNAMLPLLMMQVQNRPQTSVKEMVELINAVRPANQNQGTNIADVAKVFEMGLSAAKAQGSQQNPTDTLKAMSAFFQPFYEKMNQSDQKLWNERLTRMEQQIVNPIEALKELKAGAESLGMTQTNPQIACNLQ